MRWEGSILNKKSISVLSVIALIVISLAGFIWFQNHQMRQNNAMNMEQGNIVTSTKINNHNYAKNIVHPKAGQPVKNFTLIAQENQWEIKKGVTIPVWTYNGTVPGTEIRVTQGDFVQVELKNQLKEPVTIHWHGYPLQSAMDGIPGITQDAIKPGEVFTYEFSADIAGTYWYHSHQEGAKQVDKGLYGALIVEPKNDTKVERDYTLVLDEWMESPIEEMASMQVMGGMTSQTVDPVQSEEAKMSAAYNIYTINGKSGELIKPLDVKQGDTVRLRFINAGYRSHSVHIPGIDFRVVSTDGQDINEAGLISGQVLMIAPGERYDVEFTATSADSFYIDAHDGNKFNEQLKLPINVIGGSGKYVLETNNTDLGLFDLTSYGKHSKGIFTLDQNYDVNYAVDLGIRVDNNALKYTINSKTFNELPPLILKTGDTVKLTYDNKSTVDHPMHLHGHFFQVLSKNGVPITGSTIIKDTLLIKPGEKYVVAFKADNPGVWIEHCHELHHAAGGMMQKIIYSDYKPNYIVNPNHVFNKPE